MKVRAQLFCALLVVFAFAGQILAQGAPAAGTIEVKVGQAIDSNRDASGKEYAAIVTQTVNAGGVTITQGSLAMVTLVKAADGTSSVQLVSINMPSLGRVPASQFLGNGDGIPGSKNRGQIGVARRQAGWHRAGSIRDSGSVGPESLPGAGKHVAVYIQHGRRNDRYGCGSANGARSGGCGACCQTCAESRVQSGGYV